MALYLLSLLLFSLLSVSLLEFNLLFLLLDVFAQQYGSKNIEETNDSTSRS